MSPKTTALAIALLAATPLAAIAQTPPEESSALRRLDAWSVSGVSRAEGALPADLWTQSDAAIIANLFEQLPDSYESPAIQNLARRVILSGGASPKGDSEAAAGARLSALERMGLADELAILAAGAASGSNLESHAETAARAELTRNARNVACLRARANDVMAPSIFMLRLRAFCSAALGERGAADLALELAAEAGGREPWFVGAIAAAGGAPGARPPKARLDDALTTAISLTGGLQFEADALAEAPTLSLSAIAHFEGADPLLRAQAALRAYNNGALSPDQVRPLLLAVAEDENAPPMARALLVAETLPGSLEAANAIASQLSAASTAREFRAASALFVRDIAALTAAPDAAAALDFARAALIGGDLPLAQRLIGSARLAGADASKASLLEIAIASATGPDTGALKARINVGGAHIARDAAILVALGAHADAEAQGAMLANAPEGGQSADTAMMIQFASAIDRGATGEAGLLATKLLNEGAADMDVADLVHILIGLRRIGLDADARAIGVETILSGS